MAAGTILTVLSNIPWGQVVDNAPKVAEGATRLWKAVTGKKVEDSTGASDDGLGERQSEADVLQEQLSEMQLHIQRLEEQMSASATLIKSLAEQNTQLVAKVELNSIRLFRLATIFAIVSIALITTIVYQWH